MIKKRQHNRYTAPAISLRDYTHKIIRTGTLLAEYFEFILKFRRALAYRHPTNTCWLLISLEHKTCDHSERAIGLFA